VRKGPPEAARRPVPVGEWIVAGLGAVLVAGTLGYLVTLALTRDDAPPDVRVVEQAVRALPGGWLVQFRAINAGSQAAAELLIEGELRGPGGALETSEATIDYLPARSARDGGLIFSHDPRTHDLRLRAKSYVQP
jgi:uncharacterized protein (TIGR02588 family)